MSRRPSTFLVPIIGSVVILGILAYLVIRTAFSTTSVDPSSSSFTPANDVLAPPIAVSGEPISGISCGPENVTHHIHAHISIYIHNKPRYVPYGIGLKPPWQVIGYGGNSPQAINAACFYAIHTHTGDGVIHIESPTSQVFTLGDFFALWQEPITPGQLGPEKGLVIAYVNGSRYSDNPSRLPLTDHAVIQLQINSTISPQAYSFPSGL